MFKQIRRLWINTHIFLIVMLGTIVGSLAFDDIWFLYSWLIYLVPGFLFAAAGYYLTWSTVNIRLGFIKKRTRRLYVAISSLRWLTFFIPAAIIIATSTKQFQVSIAVTTALIYPLTTFWLTFKSMILISLHLSSLDSSDATHDKSH